MRILILNVLVLLLGSCHLIETDKELVFVKRVIDGDTFVIDDGSRKGERIRLIGIDAPETRHPRKGKEPYGEEASAFLKNLIDKKYVFLELDVQEKDRYQRTLAYVYLEDGTFVNALLVEEGFARVATFPPNVKYVDLFVDLQKQARENRKGMWSALDFQ